MLRAVCRFYVIVGVVLSYHLDEFLPKKGRGRLLLFLRFLHPSFYLRKSCDLSRGARLRLALQDLGPIFVKLGQTLSTRPDFVPRDIALELNELQDRVPAFSSEEACAIITRELGAPVDTLFLSFSKTPLASASVAQVHTAVLHSGEDVVVKVLRPNVEEKVAHDVRLMYFLARLAMWLPDGRRLRPVEVVREFEDTIGKELDLMNEAASCSNLRANFNGSDLLYVPRVFWQFCKRRVMVQERVFFANINDVEAMADHEVNKKLLAERGVEIFFTQVFRDSFFHADMHPGNIFVDISDAKNPKYCAVDFGIMGTLTPEDLYYLAENFLAFFNRDYRRVAELHVESGWVPRHTRVTEFEAAIRKVSEPIFGKPIKEISFGTFLLSLFQTARRFNMHIQPQLVLLQKTLFNVEGLGRRLYPDLDLWVTAKPVLEAWKRKQISPRALSKRLKTQAYAYARTLPNMPIVLARLLDKKWQEKAICKKDSAGWCVFSGAVLLLGALGFWCFAPSLSFLKGLALLASAGLGLCLMFFRRGV